MTMAKTPTQRTRDHRRRLLQGRSLLTVEVDLEHVAGLLMANKCLKASDQDDERVIEWALSQFLEILSAPEVTK